MTGKGVTGRVDGRSVALGNRRLLEDLGVSLDGLGERAEALRGDGQTVMFVAVDGRLAGLLGVADPIKASTPEALGLLRAAGVHVVMLTGDSRATALAIAAQARDRRRRGRGAARPEERWWSSGCRRRAASWPWPATG